VSITASPPSAPPLIRPTIVRHFVLASLLVITMINYVQRNCIGTAATTIEQGLGIPRIRLDFAMAAFFWAYTFAMVPSSWLSQRLGPRLALSLFAGGWSLATLAIAFSVGFYDLCMWRLALGVLQAGVFPCATLIIAVWYPTGQRGLATALLNSFMLIGGAFGSLLTGWLLGPVGRLLDGVGPLTQDDAWRGVFALFALPGLAWSVWFYWWFRNRPQDHPGVNQAELALLPHEQPAAAPDVRRGGSGVPWLLILTSVPLLLLFTQQAFRAGANRLFDSRLPTYFEEERLIGHDRLDSASKEERLEAKRTAATLASLPQWAGVIGGIVGGSLSDWVLRRTGSRRMARSGVAILSLLSSVGVYLLAWPIQDVWLAAGVLAFGAFLFCFSSPCAYALTIDVGGKNLAVIFGLMNMIGNLGSAVFVNSVSGLVSLGGWELLFAVWIGMHLAAMACWVFLSPDVTIGEPAPAARLEAAKEVSPAGEGIVAGREAVAALPSAPVVKVEKE
jgi:MFS family permease